jgi:hypothetical protein
MSFITDTQGKLATVANKIHRVNPSAANRLLRLREAVGHAPNSMADAWAMTDIHQMIDARVIAEQMRAKDIPPWWMRGLEWARNLLIFLPLVLTWFGISGAVSGYSAYISSILNNPHADKTLIQQPFLYLWQQGFNGYLPKTFILGQLTLSRLAFYDFLLLFALFALTAVVNGRLHLRFASQEQKAELIQEELTDALTDAALCLPRKPGQQQIGNARDVLEQMEQERQMREQELTALKTMIDSMTTSSQNMLNGGMHIQNATDQLRQTLQNLTGPVQQIVADQQQILGEMRQISGQQGAAVQNLQQLVADQQQWGAAMQRAAGEIAGAAASLNQLPGKLDQWTAQLVTLVTQLGLELDAQRGVTQQIADAAPYLRDSVSKIQDAANNLHSVAQDLFNVMNMQKVVLDTARSSFGDVAQGGNNLTYAAQLLYNAANRLNGSAVGHP